ncbi:hypothetical protein P7E02_14875 [Enterococcus hulanensis]|uniref:hypothetical protein n=1 Tax=Enterococcus hulanensis TaxID=2559929 RepID=UPI00288DCB0B|nr:hypothetical protein [Enterococcus hulanensis]MDT2661156.1 hypothetical protein [Enterococcus hulanensis]
MKKNSVLLYECISPFIVPIIFYIVLLLSTSEVDYVKISTLILSSVGGIVSSNLYTLDEDNKPIFSGENGILILLLIPIIIVFDNLSTEVVSVTIYYLLVAAFCVYSGVICLKKAKTEMDTNIVRKNNIEASKEEYEKIVNELNIVKKKLNMNQFFSLVSENFEDEEAQEIEKRIEKHLKDSHLEFIIASEEDDENSIARDGENNGENKGE